MSGKRDAALSMRAATELTGLSEHVIRAWERRYAAVRPTRSEGGTRSFSSSDVERLRLLKAAVEDGHSIGEIADLGDAALRALVPVAAGDTSHIEELIALTREGDAEGLAAELARLLNLLGGRHFALDVARPLLVRVGTLWHDGVLSVAQEHLATSVTRRHIEASIREAATDPAAPLLLLTTPEGELHEVGTLCASLLATSKSLRAIYLGPNTPADALADFAGSIEADAIVLGICALAAGSTRAYLRTLDRAAPGSMRVVVGGEAVRDVEVPQRIEAIESLERFESWLESWAKASSPR